MSAFWTYWAWFRNQAQNQSLRVQRGWRIVTRWNRLAIRGTSVIVFGYPLAVTLAALAGFHMVIGLLTFLPLLVALRVSRHITRPQYRSRLGAAAAVIFGTAVTSDRGPEASRLRRLAADVEDVAVDVLRSLRRVLLVYGGIGAYYFFTPTENIEGIAIGIMILMLLMGGSIGESRGWRTAFFLAPLLVIIVITAVLFSREPWAGDVAHAVRKALPAKAATAKVVEKDGVRVVRVALRGFGECSDVVDLTEGPVRGKNFFLGPSTARVRWRDYGDEEGYITRWWGEKGGRICFLGPASQMVTVRQVPN